MAHAGVGSGKYFIAMEPLTETRRLDCYGVLRKERLERSRVMRYTVQKTRHGQL